LEQPYIKPSEEIPSIRGFKKYMESIGFAENEGTVYWNDYYIIGDLHGGNYIMGEDGIFYIIDPVPRFNTPDDCLDDNPGKSKYLPFKVI
jgi:hypothetical protein